MKAIVYHTYGGADVLACEDIPKPAPGDDEVLIKVRAASLNPLDWRLMKGKPYTGRLMTGLSHPKDNQIGRDVAGEVEAVGRNVSQFKPGDAVFGSCRGAVAEYACAAESRLATKPDNVTYEQAASTPVAAYTALQGFRSVGLDEKAQPGQTVLINGAAGGVGTFAVQIARAFGAHVTGVCSTRSVDMVRSIGADRVVDYTQEDFTRSGQRYDILFDCIVNHSLSACRRVLNPKGAYVIVGAPHSEWMAVLMARPVVALALSPFVSQKLVTCMAKSSQPDLAIIRDLLQSGKVRPVLDRPYRLNETPAALHYLEQGHARGKVVITVASMT